VQGISCGWPGPTGPYPAPTVLNSFARNIAAASLLMITQRLFKGGSQWCSNTYVLTPMLCRIRPPT
jgi:hypothetical protein